MRETWFWRCWHFQTLLFCQDSQEDIGIHLARLRSFAQLEKLARSIQTWSGPRGRSRGSGQTPQPNETLVENEGGIPTPPSRRAVELWGAGQQSAAQSALYEPLIVSQGTNST